MSTAILTAPRNAKLVVNRKEAVAMIHTQLQKCEALRDLRIRTVQELEKSRQWKADWVQFTGAMLDQMFDSDEIAQEFNRWVGRIIPEFSDVSQFVELYHEELEFRMGKLQEILDWVQTSAEVVESRLEPAAPAAAESEASAAPQEAAVELAPPPAPTPPPQVELPPAAVAAPKPPHTAAAARRCGALIVHARDQAIEDSVSKFIGMLGYELICINDEGGGAGGTIGKLSQHPDVAFAILLADEQDIAATRSAAGEPAPQATRRSAFEMGFCTGKFGVERVCVLHASGAGLFRDDYGILYIPIDPAEGWQLQLARQLKRAGIEVDLNRLC